MELPNQDLLNYFNSKHRMRAQKIRTQKKEHISKRPRKYNSKRYWDGRDDEVAHEIVEIVDCTVVSCTPCMISKIKF